MKWMQVLAWGACLLALAGCKSTDQGKPGGGGNNATDRTESIAGDPDVMTVSPCVWNATVTAGATAEQELKVTAGKNGFKSVTVVRYAGPAWIDAGSIGALRAGNREGLVLKASPGADVANGDYAFQVQVRGNMGKGYAPVMVTGSIKVTGGAAAGAARTSVTISPAKYFLPVEQGKTATVQATLAVAGGKAVLVKVKRTARTPKWISCEVADGKREFGPGSYPVVIEARAKKADVGQVIGEFVLEFKTAGGMVNVVFGGTVDVRPKGTTIGTATPRGKNTK